MDINIASIKRFKVPILLDGKDAIAYMTVKESTNPAAKRKRIRLCRIRVWLFW